MRLFVWLSLLVVAVCSGNEQQSDQTTGVRWRDLHVSVSSDGTTLLQPSSGFIPSGHLCGIIGPSGGGKSTFLAALGGVTPNHSGLDVKGNVWWQGVNDTKSTLSMKDGQVAWLQQHDAFFSMLTTREAVDMAAFLEFPNLPKSKRNELVESSLDALGLKNVQHRPIGDRTLGRGGLSGGEKRRLSVALELLSTPRLFLADEPTTGLDSSQAGKVVRLIRLLAKERHIPCVASLHQPRASIWRMLDSFILLGPGGRVCYMGSRKDATSYFAKLGYKCPPETNPAEYFIDLMSIDTEDPVDAAKDEARIEELARAFSQHQAKNEKLHGGESVWQPPPKTNNLLLARYNRHSLRPVRWIRRSMALLRRSWRQNIRNNKINALRLLAAVGNSFLFSQIFATVKKGVPTAKSIADRVALLSFGVINMSMVRTVSVLL
jgi:ABC-type multidrug transport system ATPase subunit